MYKWCKAENSKSCWSKRGHLNNSEMNTVSGYYWRPGKKTGLRLDVAPNRRFELELMKNKIRHVIQERRRASLTVPQSWVARSGRHGLRTAAFLAVFLYLHIRIHADFPNFQISKLLASQAWLPWKCERFGCPGLPISHSVLPWFSCVSIKKVVLN